MRFLPWTNLPAAAALWTEMDSAKGLTVSEEGIALLDVGDTRPQSALVFESILSLAEGTTIVGPTDGIFAERLAASVEGCEGMRRFAAAKGERMIFNAADVPSIVYYDADGVLCEVPAAFKVVKLSGPGVTAAPGIDDCDGPVGG